MTDELDNAQQLPESTTPPEIPQIDAGYNPWGVPLLDVRPVTLCLFSTSADPQMAANAISYSKDDGRGFIGARPPVTRSVTTDLRYRIDGTLAAGVLFAPSEMEHKWALYYHCGQILCIRSWLRRVQVLADVRLTGDHVEIRAIHGQFVLDDEEPSFTTRVLDYLIRSHAMDLVYPVPLPAEMAADPGTAAMWCMSCFGKRAWFATHHELSADPPQEPLRTISLLHIAVARDDVDEAAALLGEGLPVDLLGRDGMAPLHWSLVHENTRMAEFLIERGCPVDVRSSEGATPLMNGVQARSLHKVTFLLDCGADPDARDNRGFTALHRAAEMGQRDLVELLLERGAMPDVEAQGHTPRSLAESRGQAAIADLLNSSTQVT